MKKQERKTKPTTTLMCPIKCCLKLLTKFLKSNIHYDDQLAEIRVARAATLELLGTIYDRQVGKGNERIGNTSCENVSAFPAQPGPGLHIGPIRESENAVAHSGPLSTPSIVNQECGSLDVAAERIATMWGGW